MFREVALAWTFELNDSAKRALLALGGWPEKTIDDAVRVRNFSMFAPGEATQIVAAFRRAVRLGMICAHALQTDAETARRG